MKKYIILLLIVIFAVTSISYLYVNYIGNNNEIKENNMTYEKVYNKEIAGTELATIINSTIDKNTRNNVTKDEKGYFIDNNSNSIIIEIKFKESDNIFKIEDISKQGIEQFIKYYARFKFKCTKIEYHNETKFVKYLYFEEV